MIRYLIFPLFLLGSLSSAFSQVRVIVKDIAGEPIIGANVFWLGTTTGTTTGESGKFSLPETGTSDKLVVRFVGYRSDTIHIDRVDTVWEIVLQDGAVMDEVQVSARRMGTMKIRAGILNQDMISTAELSRAACCNLGESFTTNPSVDVSYSDAATGAKQIKLLGSFGLLLTIRLDISCLIASSNSSSRTSCVLYFSALYILYSQYPWESIKTSNIMAAIYKECFMIDSLFWM